MTFDIARDLPADPFAAFADWYAEILAVDTPNSNWVVLATCSDNQPSARVVLLKQWDSNGFVFFTNYASRKGKEIAVNDRATLLVYQDSLFRQIRIYGRIEKITREESEIYFASRPITSQIGAWASKQSAPLASREELDSRVEHFTELFAHQQPRLPDNWGGYRVVPLGIEFWHGEHARLHQRRHYTRDSATAPWSSCLLYP